MKLDIVDLTARKEIVEFGPSHERLPTKAYREEVERVIRSLVNSTPALKKIQDGEPVSGEEIRELAEALAREHPFATEEVLRAVYDSPKATFEQFLGHILTGERLPSWRETVSRAFDGFIAAHTTLTSLQIRFLQTMRTFVLQTRQIEKKNLVEAPFTQIHPQGIRGVFRPEQIEEVLALASRLVA
jgi:type I restriction enzyme R subunit